MERTRPLEPLIFIYMRSVYIYKTIVWDMTPFNSVNAYKRFDRLCGLVVRVLGYRSGGPGSIPGTTRFSWGGGKKTVVGLEQGPLSLVSTTEELLDREVAAPI
jgi:hypothetical protein